MTSHSVHEMSPKPKKKKYKGSQIELIYEFLHSNLKDIKASEKKNDMKHSTR